MPEETSRGVKDLDKALSDFTSEGQQPVRVKQDKKTTKKRAKPKKQKVMQSVMMRGKRKEAIARAHISNGSGEVILNGVRVELLKPKEIRELILEPIAISKEAKDIMSSSRVLIDVRGGGISGRAQAARSALSHRQGKDSCSCIRQQHAQECVYGV
ncbi:MAG: 30S ribosomal protein S9 [Candidatus Marsarchaeota archaeon]|nr:30S ribosomal protein S9 [Candidatus Marsarchaeota archaeon]